MEMQITANDSSKRAMLEQRFGEVWKDVLPSLGRRARHLTRGDHARAEDLLANTALKALLYLRRAPDRVQDLHGLLFVVLKHVFLDSTRRQKRENGIFDYAADSDGEDGIDNAELAPSAAQTMELRQNLSLIEGIYARLPKVQQTLFEMRFHDNQSYAVIAVALDISEALARKRVELLRKRLRQALENCR